MAEAGGQQGWGPGSHPSAMASIQHAKELRQLEEQHWQLLLEFEADILRTQSRNLREQEALTRTFQLIWMPVFHIIERRQIDGT